MILRLIKVYYGVFKQNYQQQLPRIMALPMQTLPDQLDALEQRLARLLSVMENLAAENSTLRERETQLQAECEALQRKNAAASVQIESILAGLKKTASAKEE